MARNGSGTMSQSVDFTTEAASPPIEIAKLDTVLADICDEITNSIAADGQTNPSANLKMNGFRLTNLGAATALTDAARVSELIDQDHIYYVDSGSANTYVITPSPAIAAYEEGQRFVVRIANASTGASTLNVNSLGAVAIQHADGTAIASGDLAAGGIFEFTYDANASPDRWVLTSPASQIPDGMLSDNVPLLDADNTFSHTSATTALLIQQNDSTGTTANARIRAANSTNAFEIVITSTGYSGAFLTSGPTGQQGVLYTGNFPLVLGSNDIARVVIAADGSLDFKSGSVTTSNDTADEVGFKGVVQNSQSDDYTTVLTDCGKHIIQTGASKTITIAANASVAAPIGTVLTFLCTNATGCSIAITSDTLTLAGTTTTGTRTLAQNGLATAIKIAATSWVISGAGLS